MNSSEKNAPYNPETNVPGGTSIYQNRQYLLSIINATNLNSNGNKIMNIMNSLNLNNMSKTKFSNSFDRVLRPRLSFVTPKKIQKFQSDG